jgi:hypothetical protein
MVQHHINKEMRTVSVAFPLFYPNAVYDIPKIYGIKMKNYFSDDDMNYASQCLVLKVIILLFIAITFVFMLPSGRRL